MVSDSNFAPYLSVTLASLAANSSASHNYDLIILDGGLSGLSREKIGLALKGRPNFSLRFVDLGPVFADMAPESLNISRWPRAAYGRLFAPSLFTSYDRIVYLDGDLMIMDDLTGLFWADLDNNPIGGVRDYSLHDNIATGNQRLLLYCRQALKPDDLSGYINSGVLLMDLEAMRGRRPGSRFPGADEIHPPTHLPRSGHHQRPAKTGSSTWTFPGTCPSAWPRILSSS